MDFRFLDGVGLLFIIVVILLFTDAAFDRQLASLTTVEELK